MAKKYFVGVDLGGTSMRAGVVAKDGTLLALEKRRNVAACCIGRIIAAHSLIGQTEGACEPWLSHRSNSS